MLTNPLNDPFQSNFLRGGLAYAGRFDPIVAIFAGGQPGAWYAPSDFTTLYQDSAGTTPVTAVEQTVGLALDKRLGLVRGPEALTNGGFDSDTVWAKSGVTATISGGFLNFAASPNLSFVTQNVGTTTDYMEVSIVVSSVTTGAVGIQFQGSIGASISITVPGTYVYKLVKSSSPEFYITSIGASTTATVDSVSVKKIQGNHATQATAAARPLLRQDVGGNYYLAPDGIDDSLSSATGGGATAGFFLCLAIKPTGGAGTVRTIWSDAQANAGYRVRLNAANLLELSAGNGTPLSPPVQAAATTSTTGGTGLAAATTYFYVITAFNAAGESLKSNEVSILTGAGTTNSNTLSWAASAGATSYKVYRGTAAGAQAEGYVLGNVLTYVDTGAAATAGAPPTVSETAYTKVAASTATVIGTTALLTVSDDGTNLNAQLDSGAVATIARPVVAAGTAGFTIGKDNGSATGFYTGNLYAEVYRTGTAITATERAKIQAYVRAQAGI